MNHTDVLQIPVFGFRFPVTRSIFDSESFILLFFQPILNSIRFFHGKGAGIENPLSESGVLKRGTREISLSF